jgi:hypothetical protein
VPSAAKAGILAVQPTEIFLCAPGAGTVRVFRQTFTLEDAIGPHASSLEASRRVTNGIPLGSSLFLPVDTGNCVQTLKECDSSEPTVHLQPGLRNGTVLSSLPGRKIPLATDCALPTVTLQQYITSTLTGTAMNSVTNPDNVPPAMPLRVHSVTTLTGTTMNPGTPLKASVHSLGGI